MRAGDRPPRTPVGLALPATLGLIALSEPIVRMLFEHGVSPLPDTRATAHAADVLRSAWPGPLSGQALIARHSDRATHESLTSRSKQMRRDHGACWPCGTGGQADESHNQRMRRLPGYRQR